ncbi:MAG TPA: hypothetical protein DF383_12515, partial [Deltaproteobacteria bacterium]|nr:hypothetical protein [Deltaproteobacteria bacterium]
NNQAAGNDQQGGAIYSPGRVVITDSTFSLNSAKTGTTADGGAIYLDASGSLEVHNSTFTNNTANGYGGAIFSKSMAELIIENSTFDNNTATTGRGGALNHIAGKLTLSRSDFTNNHALHSSAGAIFLGSATSSNKIDSCFFDNNTSAGGEQGGAVRNDGALTLSNSTFTNNSVTDAGGGAILVNAPATTIENCTFTGNKALGGDFGDGAAIYVSMGATLKNVSVVGNEASNDGGGLYVEVTTPTTINNLTIAGNKAAKNGGGIFLKSGTLNFSNSIIAGNTDGIGNPDCFTTPAASTLNSTGPNLIQNQTTGCVVSGGGIITGDPALAASLANNGGPGMGRGGAHPTLTLAIKNNSQAFEKGANATCEPKDQRGVLRPQGTNCDLGAYEASPTADLSTMALNFSEQGIGSTSAVQTVTLTNNGPFPLTVNSISVGGANAGDFAQNNNCGATVASEASCNINVTFTPGASGPRNAGITVDTSASLGIQMIALSGTGTTPSSGGGGGCNLNPGAKSFVSYAVFFPMLLALTGLRFIRKP